jgi:hypothetical protein
MNNFPFEKTEQFRKSITEIELLQWLQSGSAMLSPAALQVMNTQPILPQRTRADGIIQAEWQGKQALYVFECKATNSPSVLEMATSNAKFAAAETNLLPLIVVPYLREDDLRRLETREASGVDMCGNGILIAPDFRIWRSGAPNRFKDTRPIRNPYRGDSSIFARCFLLRQEFESLKELQTFARQRTFGNNRREDMALSLATASKVVTTLEEELVVSKQGNAIRLTDARRLMDLLRRGSYELEREHLTGKTQLTTEDVWSRIAKANENGELRAVATGITSSSRYRLLSGVDMLSIYVDDLIAASELLEIRPGRAFANIELLVERKNVVYFDARRDGDIVWASPIQTWLELAKAGPRERDAATTLEQQLISGLAEKLT